MKLQDSYDVVVIGGGPAGCSVATITARAGHSTLLIEREKVPRFHVGESLMPETYWPLKRLGVLDKMKMSDFVKKLSVQFVSHSGKESQPFFFQQHDPRECSQTWQVERADFDKMLYDNAAEDGAHCVDETRVIDVKMDGDRCTGVTIQTADGEKMDVAARVVADGSGQSSIIASRLGMRHDDPDLKKVAIWSYYENAYRDSDENGGATIIMHTANKDSWFWFIPLSKNITSIGVVGDQDYMVKGRGTPEEIFEDELVSCPALAQRLINARNVDKFRVAKEFSYTTEQQAGDGWVLVGDAYGFIDPIYSSGVYFALISGVLAADAIDEGIKSDNISGEQLGSWASGFTDGTQWIRKLVSAFYNNDFSFGKFLKENPQHIPNLTDLLIGRIFYDGAGRIFDDMTPALEATKAQ